MQTTLLTEMTIFIVSTSKAWRQTDGLKDVKPVIH